LIKTNLRKLLALFLYYSMIFIFLILTVESLMAGASCKAATLCLMKLANWESFYYWRLCVPRIDGAVFGAIHFATSNWRFYKFYFIRPYKKVDRVFLCAGISFFSSSKRVLTRYLSSWWFSVNYRLSLHVTNFIRPCHVAKNKIGETSSR